jgi:predicted RNase H-like HicB family nuclease
MKTIHTRKFIALLERDEQGYYVATVPALSGCHTQAKNLDTLMNRVQEVVELYSFPLFS